MPPSSRATSPSVTITQTSKTVRAYEAFFQCINGICVKLSPVPLSTPCSTLSVMINHMKPACTCDVDCAKDEYCLYDGYMKKASVPAPAPALALAPGPAPEPPSTPYSTSSATIKSTKPVCTYDADSELVSNVSMVFVLNCSNPSTISPPTI